MTRGGRALASGGPAEAGVLPMRHLRYAALAAALAVAQPACAADPPPLPPSAVRVPGATIISLYDGKTYSFTNYTAYGVVTGEVTFDLKAGTNHGSYKLGPRTGTFDGTIRVVGDRFCYKAGFSGERCNYVYVDGRDVYEVKQSGIVESVKQAAAAP